MHPDRWRAVHPDADRENREVESRDRAERIELIREENAKPANASLGND